MKIDDIIKRTDRIGLDAAPVIYFVENNAEFHALCLPFFAAIDAGQIEAFASVIVLAEALVHPLRAGDTGRIAVFRNLLLETQGIIPVPLSVALAERSARLRAEYNLRTPDAIHIATALLSGCDSFLTNDGGLRCVSEIEVLVLHELEL